MLVTTMGEVVRPAMENERDVQCGKTNAVILTELPQHAQLG